MEKILFAWVGMHDLRASRENKPNELGPIARVASEMAFSRLVLLNNYGEEENAPAYVEWLKSHCEAPVELVSIDLPSPIDFAAIYVAAKSEVGRVLKKGRTNVPVFHLSPGTPAMQAVWIILAKGPFAEAELVQSSLQQGVQKVEMPFNIFAEFIPDSIASADRRLLQISEGALPYETAFGSIVHQCQSMKSLVARARLVAQRNVPVLLEGETGTGKELFARAIHQESARSRGPFVAVNCGAIPKDIFEAEFLGTMVGAYTGAKDHAGYFEQADGGTLFLDELGELPPDAQVKVLRVLNDGIVRRLGGKKDVQVDVRVISATNRDLIQEIADNNFRSDLFYRLVVAILKLPPIRDREGDLSLLIDSMLGQVNKELADSPGYKSKKFSINAKNLMVKHSWPGNAREMLNTIMRICVWCQGATIQAEDVQQSLLPSTSHAKDDILQKPLGGDFQLQEIIGVISSEYIQKALSETGGNKSKAAKLLGLKNYQTLNNWMEKYDIEG